MKFLQLRVYLTCLFFSFFFKNLTHKESFLMYMSQEVFCSCHKVLSIKTDTSYDHYEGKSNTDHKDPLIKNTQRSAQKKTKMVK